METASLSNDNHEALVGIDHDYLKPKDCEPLPTNNVLSRPRVIQWDPHTGTDQSTITVVLEQVVSSTAAAVDEIRPIKLVFGRLVVDTNQQQQRAPTASPSTTLNSQLVWITLVAQVPRLAETQILVGNQVPLSICVYDNKHSDTPTDYWDFGVFTYNNKSDTLLKQEATVHLIQGKKRGAPYTSQQDDEYTQKRQNTAMEDDQLFNQLLAPFEDSPEKTPDHVGSSQSIASHPDLSNAFIQPNHYSNSSKSVNIQPSPMQPFGYSHVYQPHINSVYSNYPSYHHQQYNSSVYPNYSQPQQPMFHAQPMMMRSCSSSTTTTTTEGDHPFAGVLGKANLKISGDMTEMTWHWSPEEWNSGRRLVRFWRKQYAAGETSQQKDNQVECGFEAIEQETYQQQRLCKNLASQTRDDAAAAGGSMVQQNPSPLVISCIYWRERNDYYITSVDCIYLLEGLIGVQFTVEEKNRIRRNLEGFRPLTVSKCKPECADFFKLIMSFPHPKPRNIEKDVKVFAWKSLPGALTKIIRKYTPSYSSTAVVNVMNQ